MVAQRNRVAAQRQVRNDRAVVLRELRRDTAPEVAVHGGAVGEHHRRAAAALAVFERSRRDLHGPALAEGIAYRHGAGIPRMDTLAA